MEAKQQCHQSPTSNGQQLKPSPFFSSVPFPLHLQSVTPAAAKDGKSARPPAPKHHLQYTSANTDDGNLQAELDSGSFWVLFGGFAPISKKVATDDDIVPERTTAQLYSITDGQVNQLDGELTKSILENNKCYILDYGSEVFTWVGRHTQLEERKSIIQTTEEYLANQNRPKSTLIIRIIQGYETHSFKSNFESWPSGSTPAPEDGRGKVAALVKQQGAAVKDAGKSTSVDEEVPPLLEEGGKIEVWCIDGSAKTQIPKEDIGKFYGGDCYIVLCTYHSHERKKIITYVGGLERIASRRTEKWLHNWLAQCAIHLKGDLCWIYQGKEPPQFVAIFQPMLVLKGGLSSGYKNHIEENGLNDENYASDTVGLFRISGTSSHNNKAVQVDVVASSLNTYECFLLQSSSLVFIWHGKQSTHEQQNLAAKIVEFLKPGATVKHTKEGTESSAFWLSIGEKQDYTSNKLAPEATREPHLFSCSVNRGKFEVEEIYNFTQDDLLTEDFMVLDTHAEVFVWVGQSTDSKEKQSAFEIGQKYVEMATSLEGLSSYVPLYKVTEGNEPCFFTTFFSWDPVKATAHGNSFQKKVMILFGFGHASENDRTNQDGPTQKASALAALNSAFTSSAAAKASSVPKPTGASQSSQRVVAVAALSNILTEEMKQSNSRGSSLILFFSLPMFVC